MNYTPVYGWYFISLGDRAPAWSGVVPLYDFLTGKPEFLSANGGVGPFGREAGRSELEIGDVIQLQNPAGQWYHSVLVTGFDGSEILVSAQSDDSRDRPLSTYTFFNARFLHVEGVRIPVDDDACFRLLLSGGE